MAGRKRWRLAFALLCTKGGDIMTAYEILIIAIMIITLAFGIHNSNHK